MRSATQIEIEQFKHRRKWVTGKLYKQALQENDCGCSKPNRIGLCCHQVPSNLLALLNTNCTLSSWNSQEKKAPRIRPVEPLHSNISPPSQHRPPIFSTYCGYDPLQPIPAAPIARQHLTPKTPKQIHWQRIVTILASPSSLTILPFYMLAVVIYA